MESPSKPIRGFRIYTGLPERFTEDAAKLYWVGFQDKLGRFLSPKQSALSFFKAAIQHDNAVVAISANGDKLLGIAGFDAGEGGFIGGTYNDLREIYGLLPGLWRGLGLSLYTRGTPPDTLQLDGIVVTENARSQGIGGALLQALIREARLHGKASVSLDVVDGNTRAMALYQRQGFIKTQYRDTGPLKYLMGVQGVTTMQRHLS